jgi:hypothetical protein
MKALESVPEVFVVPVTLDTSVSEAAVPSATSEPTDKAAAP